MYIISHFIIICRRPVSCATASELERCKVWYMHAREREREGGLNANSNDKVHNETQADIAAEVGSIICTQFT